MSDAQKTIALYLQAKREYAVAWLEHSDAARACNAANNSMRNLLNDLGKFAAPETPSLHVLDDGISAVVRRTPGGRVSLEIYDSAGKLQSIES